MLSRRLQPLTDYRVSTSQRSQASCGSFFANLLLSDNVCEYLASKQRSFKEVIQPQVPLRLPCYDFTPVIDHTVDGAPLAVKLPASGAVNSHGVTGGVYKARERIHRDMLIRDY